MICGDDVYGGTNWYFSNIAKQNGITVEMLDLRNIEILKKKINNKTRVIKSMRVQTFIAAFSLFSSRP